MRYDDRSPELRVLEYVEAAGNASCEEMERWTGMDEDDVHEGLYRLREDDVVFEYGGEFMRSWRVPDPAAVRDLLTDEETEDLYAFIRENDDAEHPRYGFRGVPLTGIFHEHGIDAVRDPFVAEDGDEKVRIYQRLEALEEVGLIDRRGFNARYEGGLEEGSDGIVDLLGDVVRSSGETEYRFKDDWGHAGAFFTATELPDVYEEMIEELA